MYRIAIVAIIASVLTSTIILPYASAFADEANVSSDVMQTEAKTSEPNLVEIQASNVKSTQHLTDSERTALQDDTKPAPYSVDASSKISDSDANFTKLITSNGTSVAGPETAPNLIITSFVVSSTIEYLELYNQSDIPYDLKDISFSATYDDKPCTLYIASQEWLLPRSFIAVSSPTSSGTTSIRFMSDCLFDGTISRLELFSGISRLQLVDGIIGNPKSSWFRHRSTVKSSCAESTIPSTLKQTGSSSTDFMSCTNGPPARASETYMPPNQSAITIVEIMSNSRSCTPDETSDDCFDYVKVKNVGSVAVNLAELRLRTGSAASSASMSTSFHWMQPTLNPLRDEYMLEPGAILTIRARDDGNPISITNDEGNVWIEDYFGIKTYQSVHYSDMGLSVAKGKSWALDGSDGIWKYGSPSPYGENTILLPVANEPSETVPSELKPCRDDQYRSEETNRCRSLVQANSSMPCKEGQYRSEETNRCRSIVAVAASILKPCADDQFRNPETNRCRKIVGPEDLALADCGEGRERNPETNRCRNIVRSAPAPADFAIEPIKEPVSVFIGWWILGGVALLVVGYAGWEWRQEIGQRIRKIAQFTRAGR